MMTSESILTRNSLIDFEWRFLNVHNIIIYFIFISLYVFQKQLHNLYVAQWNEISLSIAASIQLSIVSRCCVWSVCVYEKKSGEFQNCGFLYLSLTNSSITNITEWIHQSEFLLNEYTNALHILIIHWIFFFYQQKILLSCEILSRLTNIEWVQTYNAYYKIRLLCANDT